MVFPLYPLGLRRLDGDDRTDYGLRDVLYWTRSTLRLYLKCVAAKPKDGHFAVIRWDHVETEWPA